MITAVGTGVWFHLRFLQEFQPARWALRLLQGLLGLALVNVLLLSIGQDMPALRINILSAGLASIFAWLAALTAQVWKQERAAGVLVASGVSKRWLVALYSLLLVVLLITMTTGVGWMQATGWSMYISQTQGLVTSLLLLMMLQYRAYAHNLQRQQTMLALESARLQVVHEQAVREEQGKLLAMLAHEIKTPLATMHLRLDGQAAVGQEIHQAMRDMNQVIDRCVQSLHVDDGKFSAVLQTTDLVGHILEAVAACPQAARIEVEAPPVLLLRSDPQMLFMVLSNLLDNACKYAAEGSPIRLQAKLIDAPSAGQAVRLSVSNRPGKAGWPDPAQLFDKYYRAPQAQHRSGTGLGLYLVQALSEALGGRIEYCPDADQLHFVLTLPVEAGRGWHDAVRCTAYSGGRGSRQPALGNHRFSARPRPPCQRCELRRGRGRYAGARCARPLFDRREFTR